MLPVASTTGTATDAPRSEQAPGDFMGVSLAEYERSTVVMMPLEATIAIPFRQERDRCYAVVLRIQPGGRLSKRVSRDGVTVGDGGIGEGEHVRLHEQGGSAWFCPLAAASKRLHIYYVMPTDRRLGWGQLAVEVWSKKMPAQWVREELENRRIADRYLDSQAPQKSNPQCIECAQQHERCRAAGRTGDDDFRCTQQMQLCYSDRRC